MDIAVGAFVYSPRCVEFNRRHLTGGPGIDTEQQLNGRSSDRLLIPTRFGAVSYSVSEVLGPADPCNDSIQRFGVA